ncbi:hypothetical protein DH2020_015290 [Rehmannia glutinosa]|uniref:Cyclin C-terminal domain-containing protein n=1 Tax=Rehmannia glutinosa TaxID=99300 RepID=A0ABR0WS66_REHGL
MADYNSFDCAASDLLCNEETKGLGFFDNDFVDQIYQSNGEKGELFSCKGSDLEASVYLPCLSEQCIVWMVEREKMHLPRNDYLERLKCGELDVDKKWAVQLIAVACLSLAAKIEEVNVPSTVDLQMNNGEFPSGHTIDRSLRIIISTIEDIDFLEFRPSEIAAAVAMYVAGEKLQTIDIDKTLFGLIGIEKGRVLKCLEMIRNSISISTTITSNSARVANVVSVSSSEPNSPNGVLEAACLSYKSDERTVESCPSSSHSSPDTKRRKLDQTATLEG